MGLIMGLGFRRGRSDENNLLLCILCFFNTLIHTMESGSLIDVIYTDFSNAFDFMYHSVLIANYACLV
jgi:hypothetical protein